MIKLDTEVQENSTLNGTGELPRGDDVKIPGGYTDKRYNNDCSRRTLRFQNLRETTNFIKFSNVT